MYQHYFRLTTFNENFPHQIQWKFCKPGTRYLLVARDYDVNVQRVLLKRAREVHNCEFAQLENGVDKFAARGQEGEF
jgi:hypothetical protein